MTFKHEHGSSQFIFCVTDRQNHSGHSQRFIPPAFTFHRIVTILTPKYLLCRVCARHHSTQNCCVRWKKQQLLLLNFPRVGLGSQSVRTWLGGPEGLTKMSQRREMQLRGKPEKFVQASVFSLGDAAVFSVPVACLDLCQFE